jgi:hypothetical protein
MKEKSSTSCEVAAARVQCWFGKDKDNLWCATAAISKPQDFCKNRKCGQVQPPKVASQIERLPLQGYAVSKKKKPSKKHQVTTENPSKPLGIAIDGSHCSINQKNLNYITSENALSSARVAYCKLREYLLVSKRLKNISKQHHLGPKRHEVVCIQSSVQENLSQNPYLQEWGKTKEERHFHVGRVIKYLTD